MYPVPSSRGSVGFVLLVTGDLFGSVSNFVPVFSLPAPLYCDSREGSVW